MTTHLPCACIPSQIIDLYVYVASLFRFLRFHLYMHVWCRFKLDMWTVAHVFRCTDAEMGGDFGRLHLFFF